MREHAWQRKVQRKEEAEEIKQLWRNRTRGNICPNFWGKGSAATSVSMPVIDFAARDGSISDISRIMSKICSGVPKLK